jgi:hypothetical protein
MEQFLSIGEDYNPVEDLLPANRPVSPNHPIGAAANFSQRFSTSLCPQCQEIAKHLSSTADGEETHLKHHETYSSLQISADNGCGLCIQFILGLEDTVTQDDFDPPPAFNGGDVLIRSHARYFWPAEYKRLQLTVRNSENDSNVEENGQDSKILWYLKCSVDLIPCKPLHGIDFC